MPAGQIASILAFSSSDQTSTLTTTWCALNSHPDSTDFNLSQVALATTTGSFDGGDQGLLNTHFSSWATQVKTAPNLVGSSIWRFSGYFEAPAFLVQHGRLCLLLLPARLQEVWVRREDHSFHRRGEALGGRGGLFLSHARGWAQETLVATLLHAGISCSLRKERTG